MSQPTPDSTTHATPVGAVASTEVLPSAKRLQAGMGFIMLVVLIDLIAIGIIIPVLPMLVGTFTDGKDAQAYWFGAMSFAFGIASFFGGPILGSLSDRYGRRPILLIGFLGLAINFFMTGLATTLWMLILSRLIGGGMQANAAVANAYVADITPPEKRAQQFGKLGAMFGLGFILGPVMGGLLGAIDIHLPFFVAGGLACVNWVYGYFVLPESLPLSKREPFSWRRANPVAAFQRLAGLEGMRLVVVVIALSVLAQFMVHTSWVLYTHFKLGWSTADVGWSLALVGLSATLTQGFLVKPLVKRWGRRRLASVSLVSGFFAAIGYGLANSTTAMLCVVALNFLSQAGSPALSSMVSEAATETEQGRVMGALSSVNSLMAVVAPLLAAPLLAYMSHLNPNSIWAGAPFFACAGVLLCAIVMLTIAFKRRPLLGV